MHHKKAAALVGSCLLMLLAACGPSADEIAAHVKVLLQAKINEAMPETIGSVAVSSVTAIQESGHKYQGLASITAYGENLSLKLDIMADRKNIIYETNGLDWGTLLLQAHQAMFKITDGKYADVAVTDDALFALFPPALARSKAQFAERLQTVVPIKREGNYLFGSGCKAHDCGANEAAWTIDTTTGKGAAVYEQTAEIDGQLDVSFEVYGDSIEDLPPPLLSWALEHGITSANSAVPR